jgi:hypothetical protein
MSDREGRGRWREREREARRGVHGDYIGDYRRDDAAVERRERRYEDLSGDYPGDYRGGGPGRFARGDEGRRAGGLGFGGDLEGVYGGTGAGRRGAEGEHRGRGPRGYTRPDERIRDDVNDGLTEDPELDASDIEVAVTSGEVTLAGMVETRRDKRRAEDIADRVSGVRHVQNNLRPRSRGA